MEGESDLHCPFSLGSFNNQFVAPSVAAGCHALQRSRHFQNGDFVASQVQTTSSFQWRIQKFGTVFDGSLF
jgi:hypothetical protein